MSERLFRFNLKELKTIRLVCKNPDCGAVLEVPIERMRGMTGIILCQACKSETTPFQRGDNLLKELADVMLKVRDAGYVDVGFSLPVEE